MEKTIERKKLISIVVPVFNEEDVIEAFTQELFSVLSRLDVLFEVIFVNDGSEDNTSSKIKHLINTYSSIKSIEFTRNFGHQYALWAGIEYASGDAVIMMDSDLQHPPSLIPRLITEWEAGAYIVQTVRNDIRIPLFKKLTSKLFYHSINLFSDVKFHPSTADFRLIDKIVVHELLQLEERDIFLRGLLPWLGFDSTLVHFDVQSRVAGESKYSFMKMMKFATSGITAFSTVPLKLIALTGLIISLISFITGLHAIYAWMFLDAIVRGWPSVMVGVFFLGGLSMIFMGILGEYLGKVFLEVKKRPKYVIKELRGFNTKNTEQTQQFLGRRLPATERLKEEAIS